VGILVEEFNSSMAYALMPYAAVGGVAVISVWAVCWAYARRRKAKRVAMDMQAVDQTIVRAEALEQFWEQGMLPNALAGEGMFKEDYVRDMLSTIRRMHAELLPLLDQVQNGTPLDASRRKHLAFLRKELNRCMQRPDGQYFDLATTLAEFGTSREVKREAPIQWQARSLMDRPAAAQLAERTSLQRDNNSSDGDWMNPLNPFSPLSPLNPLSSVSPWSLWQSEPGHQDESDRHQRVWGDRSTSDNSSLGFFGGNDSSSGNDGGRSLLDCSSSSDSGGSSNDSPSNDSNNDSYSTPCGGD